MRWNVPDPGVGTSAVHAAKTQEKMDVCIQAKTEEPTLPPPLRPSRVGLLDGAPTRPGEGGLSPARDSNMSGPEALSRPHPGTRSGQLSGHPLASTDSEGSQAPPLSPGRLQLPCPALPSLLAVLHSPARSSFQHKQLLVLAR